MILTLRTWTVWNRNRCLSIILPILYSIFLALSFTIMVRVIKSSTCKWNFHAYSWLYGWFISWQSVHHHFQDTRDVPWHMAAKVWFFCGPYWYSGMLVSVKVPFHFPPLIEKITSVVDTHVDSCHPSMWAILVSTVSSSRFILLILGRNGARNTSLTTVVYRDGKSLHFSWLQAPLNVDIGIIYYLYLFGRSCAREWLGVS